MNKRRFAGSTLLYMFEQRELVREMAFRELKSLNKGAFLGTVWLVLGPLIQVAAYVVIVSLIFGKRLGDGAGTFDYAIYVLSGMVPWQILTRSLQEAPSQIRMRMELVKQVIYPIETLPMTSLLVSSFGALVSFTVFVAVSVYAGKATWGYLLVPVPFALLAAFILGFSWLFSIAGVFVKDLREVVAVLLGLLVYVSPVLASESLVGPKVWKLIELNPLSHVVICFRDAYYLDFHPWSWAIFAGMTLVVFLLGERVILRTKTLINEYI